MPNCLPEHPTEPHPAPGWQAVGQTPLGVYSVAAIRAAEQLAFADRPSFGLMHSAGTQAAAAIVHWSQQSRWAKPPLFVVLAGPGNNGGDACIVAACLHQAKHPVHLVNLASRSAAQANSSVGKSNTNNPSPTNQGTSDRQQALKMALEAGLNPLTLEQAQQHWAHWQQDHALCVVDGLLGIGAQNTPSGAVGQALQWLHQCLPSHSKTTPSASEQAKQTAVVALDCPSGLNCDTGLPIANQGSQGKLASTPIAADLTLSLIACKPGLLWGAGKDLCGQTWVHSLGCEPHLADQAHMQCPAANTWQALRPQRQHAQHKGSFGSVAVLGGAQGMVGAALLAGRTALMLGAGRVAISCHEQTLDPMFPELMFKPWEHNQNFAPVWLMGPGLGQSTQGIHTLLQALASWPQHLQRWPKPHNPAWVLDADALNILAAQPIPQPNWNHSQVVITPHPLEAGRLLGCTVDDIQNQRLQTAQNLAQRYQCTVVLKGAGTVVANAHGQAWVHSSGGPALATAGSGDVLAGAIAAFLAQGCSAWQAANAAVGLHGMVVEALPGQHGAACVLTASAIAQRMQMRLNA